MSRYFSSIFKSSSKVPLNIQTQIITKADDPMSMEMLTESCSHIIKNLKNMGVNLFAVDFDLTLVDEHTGGAWLASAEELAPKIRPIFKILLPKLIDSGIFVAIVTFSPQVELISDVLTIQYQDYRSKIVIRGCDGSWDFEGWTKRDGKQKHMISAIEEINMRLSLPVSLESTILVDDDPNNIKVARLESVKAVQCFPDNPNRLIADLTTKTRL